MRKAGIARCGPAVVGGYSVTLGTNGADNAVVLLVNGANVVTRAHVVATRRGL